MGLAPQCGLAALAVLLCLADAAAQATYVITPSEIVLPLGGAQRLELRDAAGAPVTGAEWSVGTPGVAALSTSPKVTVAAVSPGQTTIVADIGGATAEATVTVLPASEVPADTVMWKVPRATPDDGTVPTVLRAQNDTGLGADLFTIEAGQGTPVVRGLRQDGTESWRRTLSSDTYVSWSMADADGGIILSTYEPTINPNGHTISRLDGVSGAQTWGQPHNGYVFKPALRPDGVAVAWMDRPQDLRVVGFHSLTGQLQFDAPVSDSNNCGSPGEDGVSNLTIGWDGRVYGMRLHSDTVGPDGCYYEWTLYQALDLIEVLPDGTLSVVATIAENNQSIQGWAPYYWLDYGDVFPGPAGGLTTNWRRVLSDWSVPPVSTMTTINGGRSDVAISSTIVAVGSDGTGYGWSLVGPTFDAVDVLSGAPRWQSPEGGEVAAVLSDASVVVKTFAGDLRRIDASGQSTSLTTVSGANDVSGGSGDVLLIGHDGSVIAIPGDANELDGLFPLQDGNPARQRAQPAPALVGRRATVIRGESARFTVSGVMPAQIAEWRFTPDETNLPAIIRTNNSSTTWSGSIVAAGTVQLTYVRGGSTHVLKRRVDVAARPGFTLAITPPPAEQKTNGYDPDGAGPEPPMLVSRPPTPPIGGQNGSVVDIAVHDVPYSFTRGSQILDSGPNHGLRPVNGIGPAPGSLVPYYVYVVSPDFEPDQEFYQRQCGTWGEANPMGIISGAILRTNTFQHVAGATGLSHYVQFIDALSDTANDLGQAIEQIVVGGAAAASTDSYDAVVRQRMADGVLSRINTAAALEPCKTVAYDGSTGTCQFRGYMNYPPYQSCP